MAQIPISLKTKRVLVNEKEPPIPAHRFAFTRVGADVYLEVGHFDLTELSAAIQAIQKDPQQKHQPSLYVTDRFVLTPPGALSLLETAKQLVQDLQKNGIIKVSQAAQQFGAGAGSD